MNEFTKYLTDSITSLKTKASDLSDIDESLELQDALNLCTERLGEGVMMEVDQILNSVAQRIEHLYSLVN